MNVIDTAALIVGIAAGAFLGQHWAIARNRNPMAWGLAGALLPVTVIVLWLLKPLPAPVEEVTAEEAEA
ncbi:MAG: hypothetical protein K1X51_07860 [Rhodospirillaceae bacterium]|nr:hypothetical protein [Rhodospirillaceae bacterium]